MLGSSGNISNNYVCNNDNCQQVLNNEMIWEYFADPNEKSHLISDLEHELELEHSKCADIAYSMRCPNCYKAIMINLHIHIEVERYEDNIFRGLRSVNIRKICGSDWESKDDVDYEQLDDDFKDYLDNLDPNSFFRNTGEVTSCIIVAKTNYKRGFCYLGYSEIDRRFYRPHFRSYDRFGKDVCCWPSGGMEMEIGTCYTFNHLRSRNENTSYPHANEDLFVDGNMIEGNNIDPGAIYNMLKSRAQLNIKNLFPDLTNRNGKLYVLEDTQCNSVGILEIKRKYIKEATEDSSYSGKPSKRLWMKQGFQRYNIPWTSIQAPNLSQIDGDEDVLIILGFARGLANDGWEGKRCYLLAIGLLRNPSFVNNNKESFSRCLWVLCGYGTRNIISRGINWNFGLRLQELREEINSYEIEM